MKFFLRVSFCLFTCLLYAFPLHSQDKNLVRNSGFEEKNFSENKIPFWNLRCFSPYPQEVKTGYPQGTIDKDTKFSGEQSLKITTRKNEDNVIFETSVPVTAGKIYKVSFRYKNNDAKLTLRENHIDAAGTHNNKKYKNIFETNNSNDWKLFEGKIAALDGDSKIGVTFFVGSKLGEVWIDDVNIEEAEVKSGDEVQFRMTPNFYTDDNICYIPRNNPMPVLLTVANEAQYKAEKPELIIELPAEVELLSSDYDSYEINPPVSIEKNGQKYTRYNYSMGLPRLVLRNIDYNNTAFGSTILLLKTKHTPSDKIFDAFIYFKDGTMICKPCNFKIKIMPELKKANTPKYFRTGIFTEASIEFYGKPLEEFAAFYKKCGFNEIYIPDLLRAGSNNGIGKNRDSMPIVKQMKENGVTTVIASNCLTNGYCIRYTPLDKDVPISARIKTFDGTVIDKNTFDPAYIRRKGEWYMKSVDYVIENVLKSGGDSIWVNWEPWMYVMEKGSFSEDSMKDFAEFSKIPYDTIKEMKPSEIIKKHEVQLMAFQSWQFAKSMEVLNDTFREKSLKTGKKLELIAAVGPNTLDYPVKGKSPEWKYTACFNGNDYLKYFDIISSWYYLFMDYNRFSEPSNKELWKLGYRLGESTVTHTLEMVNLTNLGTLKLVEEKVAYIKNIREQNKQKTIPYQHIIQGIQCNNWFVNPESIGSQMLASFIGGAQGASLYYFPRGYDGRYWKSASEANDIIAFYEDYVFSGKKISSGFSLSPETELFKNKNYTENLTWRAFEYKGKTLLALCNFDFIDKAYLKLNCENLPSGTYSLNDPYNKEYFCEAPGKGLSAESLKNVLLEVPAETIKFIVLEKFIPDMDYGKPVLLGDIKKKAETEIPELNRKFAERLTAIEKLKNNKKVKNEVFNRNDVKTLKENSFTASIETVNGVSLYTMANGIQSLVINPEFGATVNSWKIENIEMVVSEKNNGLLARDRFYIPKEYMDSKVLSGVYNFISHSVKNDIIEVEFEKKINEGALDGFCISKIFAMKKGEQGFKVNYRITNKQTETRTVGFWVFNCPEAFSKKNDTQPLISFGNGKYENLKNSDALFVIKNKSIADGFENHIKSLLSSRNNCQTIDSSNFSLQGKSSKIVIETPVDKTYGAYTWSSLSSGFITFELIFMPTRIEAGKTWETEVSYKK